MRLAAHVLARAVIDGFVIRQTAIHATFVRI